MTQKFTAVPLLPWDDKRLRRRCRSIGRLSGDVKDLFERLIVTMRENKGIGLAAPQIGDMRRACVLEANGHLLFMANPVVLHASGKMIIGDEGCLSFPGITHRVLRHDGVRVGFQDYFGERREYMLSGIMAVAAQHEIDHLDGMLFHMRAHDSAMWDAVDA